MTNTKQNNELTFAHFGFEIMEIKHKVYCKHNKFECDKCGIFMEKAYPHKTIKGKGLIARIK